MSRCVCIQRVGAALLAASFLTTSVTGCVSPYVGRPALQHDATYPATTLPAALKYADDTEALYRARIVALGEGERLASVALITLGAAILLAGAYGAHRDTITGLAGAGALGYSVWTFTTDKRRASIYVAGMKALICARAAVAPLHLSTTAETTLAANLKTLTTRKAAVAAAIVKTESLVRALEAAGTNATETQAARQDMQAATAILAKATGSEGAVDQLRLNQGLAGARLKNSVDEIDAVVLDALRGTEASLQAVPQVIAGLATSMQLMAPQAKIDEALKRSTEGPHALVSGTASKDAKDLADAVSVLKREAVLLDADAARVNSFLSAIDPPKVLQALSTCKVEGLPGDFTLEQTELQFKAKTADKKSLHITGPGAPFFGEVENNPAGVSVEHTKPDVLTVAVTDQVAAGTHRLFVQDKSRAKRQVVTIKIAAAEAASGGGTTNVTPAASGGSADALVKDINAKSTVRVGTTDVSVTAEKRPDNKVVEVTFSVAAGSDITEAQVKSGLDTTFDASNRIGSANVVVTRGPDVGPHALIARRGAPVTRWGPVVQGLDREQVRLIQRRLCLTGAAVDGLWGSDTQTRLDDDRARRRAAGARDVANGMLTRPEATALMTSGATDAAARCRG